jgi:hypothetical protein
MITAQCGLKTAKALGLEVPSRADEVTCCDCS